MSKALRPSEITLPPGTWPTVLAFLCQHFHRIDAEIWRERVASGKVHWFAGAAIATDTPYHAGRRLCYYREVPTEPRIADAHQILFQNQHIIVACKPHGLPVTPGGDFVNECLLERVRRDTGVADLAPVHRLDRDTAGIVLFSCDALSRPSYYDLFASGRIEKQYRAVAPLPTTATPFATGQHWQVQNRIEKSDPRFLMQVVDGEPNAHSSMQLLAIEPTALEPATTSQQGLFALTPHTGKTHQLRLHMAGIGAPLLGDNYYPRLLPKVAASDTTLPLQLLAQQLRFIDPVDGSPRHFQSSRRLAAWQGEWC